MGWCWGLVTRLLLLLPPFRISLIVNPLNLDGWVWGDDEEQEEGEGVESLGLS